MQHYVVFCGSVAYDYIMDYPGDLNENLTTDKNAKKFNLAVMPSTKTMNFGGTAGNIAYNAGQLGIPCKIITAVGRDFHDLGYERHLAENPTVEFSGRVFEDEFTASCHIVNDKYKNQLVIFHGGVMAHSPELSLTACGIQPSLVSLMLISPDNREAMVAWVHQAMDLQIPYIFDPGQVSPHFLATDLEEIIPQAYVVIGNEFEIGMIEKTLQCDRAGLLKRNPNWVITMGGRGSICFTEGNETPLPICNPQRIVDTTGAGDAYRAGLVFGLLAGKSLIDACRIGATVASFSVETLGPQTQQLDIKQVRERYEKTFGVPWEKNV